MNMKRSEAGVEREPTPTDGPLSKGLGGPPSDSASSPLYKKMAIVTHSIIFIYSAAFWIQIGVMPVSHMVSGGSGRALHVTCNSSPTQFLSKSLGADPVVFGYMETVFAIAMLLGGPIFGRFGDLFGARSALLMAFVSSFLTYAVLAFAGSIPALFLSRIFAFMMHAMHGESLLT